LLDAWANNGRFEVRFADLTDPAALAAGLDENPALVWVETPSNPLLRITDIRHVARAAHAAGALCVVDNTFLSPALQQPLTLGADVVVHSTTKYINGHSDVVGGAAIAREPDVAGKLKWWGNCLGLAGAPFDSWLTLRGLRTLTARLRVHQDNAVAIAELLDGHPAVTHVFYPGLASHPQHALAVRQQAGFGAMLGFDLAGGENAVRAFLDGLHCITLAESLGGVESLVAHPASMTHAAMSAEARRAAGISDTLLRLSVGIEDIGDLSRDLRAGLARAAAATSSHVAVPA
jgi:cystathionine gamma-synthase